ncbi:MAG TPA: pentapeptide repeat-containing protein [Bryobacteraceae bacterium]
MLVRERRKRPDPWKEYKESVSPRWTLGFHAVEWIWHWAGYYLDRWAFLEVLESLGVFSVLIAVIFYFSETGDRIKQKHYQAWQVINTAQGKGGSGGRIEALQELNRDRVPLVGINAAAAFLQGVRLHNAKLLRCNLDACDLRNSDLSASDMQFASLKSANFRDANLSDADLRNADLQDADLNGANLRNANLNGATLTGADLRNADLGGARWQNIESIDKANIYGARNIAPDFAAWALQHGAVSSPSDLE